MIRKGKHAPVSGGENYSFCEAVTAGPYSRWHIRRLDETGRHLGGGITAPSLCGRVSPRFGGWDLVVDITEHHLGHACPYCVAAFLETVRP